MTRDPKKNPDEKPPLTPEQATEVVRASAREGTLVFAEQNRVAALGDECQRVLDAIDIGRAWISDRSKISDFGLSDETLEEARKKLGVPVERKDYVWEVAFRLQTPDDLPS
jgi:hypothetical protein